MSMHVGRSVLVAFGVVTFAGCGDNAVDPVFAPPLIQIEKGTGAVMPAVRIVPVFFAADPLRDELVTNLAAYASSELWTVNVAEYGVGPASSGTAIDLGTAPPAVTDDEIRAFLLDRLDGSHPEWGPTDPTSLASTVFVIFYPETTSVTGPLGRSCVDFGAYHDAVSSPGIIYAVMPRCDGPPAFTRAEGLFAHAVHEVVESATDPYGDGWNFVSGESVAFAAALGGTEISDLCQSPDDHYRAPGIGVVQRHWSNAAAAAFRRPCVPDDRGPFLAAVPDTPDVLAISQPSGSAHEVPGVALTVGVPRRVQVHLASSAPTNDWSVRAVISGRGASPILFTLDRGAGNNGDTLELELTAVTVPTDGVATITLLSELDGSTLRWATLIGVRQ